MRKLIIFLFFLTLLLVNYTKSNEEYYINNGIRYRIISSSDSYEDQLLKKEVNKIVYPYIESFSASTIEKTRQNILNGLSSIDSELKKINIEYELNYGDNLFPQKEYNNVFYPEANYESLVIKLGEAKGHNWWCFMFPPLCNLEYNKEDLTKVEYDFYFKKIIKNYFDK